jgi:hypothetical protein
MAGTIVIEYWGRSMLLARIEDCVDSYEVLLGLISRCILGYPFLALFTIAYHTLLR